MEVRQNKPLRFAASAACIGVWIMLSPSVYGQIDNKQNREVGVASVKCDEFDGTITPVGTWEELSETLIRCALESALTAFFIRPGNPPPQVNDVPKIDPPAQDNNPPAPPPPPPDPPTGGGETPPGDPPFDPPPPPDQTPEPTSLITALLGIGFTSVYAWRKRRNRTEKK